MREMKKIVTSFLIVLCFTMSFSSLGFADEVQTVVSNAETQASTEVVEDGEFISNYVSQVVDYLAMYANEGVTQNTLYKAALFAVLKDHPELYEEVMTALLSSIDEHSVFYKSGEFEQFISQLESSVGGIGVTFNEDGENLIVGAVYEDTPAEKAGILPGDILYSVDGNSLIGLNISAAQKLIRGEVGSTVTIGVIRAGEPNVLYFNMVREEIGVKQSVSYEIVPSNQIDGKTTDKNEDVMYIKIYGFMDNTAELFGKAMDEADSKNITNIIIDVRDNGGGYVNQAALVANYFVPKGNVIVTEDHKIDLLDVVYKSNNERTQKNDVVILVNENSASASEILTAALKENKVGVVIGTQTYGKGTVQSSVSLKDNEAMKFTVAYYLTPDGNNINKIGITPDAVVKNTYVPFDCSGYSDFDYDKIYEIGESSPNVAKAKKILSVWGAYSGDVNSEVFDSELASAIALFQSNEGLFPYGVLDITTQTALYNELKNTKVTVDEQLEAAFSHFGQAYLTK